VEHMVDQRDRRVRSGAEQGPGGPADRRLVAGSVGIEDQPPAQFGAIGVPAGIRDRVDAAAIVDHMLAAGNPGTLDVAERRGEVVEGRALRGAAAVGGRAAVEPALDGALAAPRYGDLARHRAPRRVL